MLNKLKFLLLGLLVSWNTLSWSQSKPPENPEVDSLQMPKDWFNLDPQENGVMGTSADKAYELLLKGKSPKTTVVVAVIDSGVDIEHEDLEGKIWVNEDEIPENGKDDDGNGYIDDVNGWNFIGGKDGTHVGADTYELTREYARLEPIYGGVEEDQIKKKQEKEYKYWLTIKSKFEETKKEAEMNYEYTSTLQENLTEVAEIIKSALGKENFTAEDLEGLGQEDEKVKKAGFMLAQLFNNIGQEGTGINEVLEELSGAVKHYKNQIEFAYNPDFDPRHIVGDDPNNYKEKIYGNNNVKGPDSSHGTHVSGIIAADRNNSLGIRGITEHALIMPIRAVPDGDERDKDVANAIYYAVDNGADIINMSFGKSYSPGKKYVDKAVRYAKRKGVIMIHAAGNSGEEVTATNNFPNKWLKKRNKLFGKDRVASNWIEVGASSWQGDENLPGSFSNYSGKLVDLFAPGVEVYSTIPGNEYQSNSGTSMAAPVVSGVTALIMAYYPKLKPSEIREILRNSVYNQSEQKVIMPGKDEEVAFGSLSITGGLVNAYQALELAESLSK
jgi:subtilisin family serine protease